MRLCTLALAVVLSPSMAVAQAFPSKPLRMVVPFPPGSGLDMTARLVSMKMQESLGQPVVVENRAGANGAIGSEFVSKSPADGYTLLAATPSTHVTSVHLTRSLPYHPLKDFTPITKAVDPVVGIVTPASFSANSVKELLDFARANPGKLSYASSGIGSSHHLSAERLKMITGVEMVHIPYKGVAPAMAAVASGEVQVSFIALASAMPFLKSGKVKLLASFDEIAIPGMAPVPLASSILPDWGKPLSWYGFFGPPGMPPPLLARIHSEMARGLNAPDVKPKLDAALLAVAASLPADFAAQIRSEIDIYGQIIRAAGIKPE